MGIGGSPAFLALVGVLAADSLRDAELGLDVRVAEGQLAAQARPHPQPVARYALARLTLQHLTTMSQ